MSNWTLTQHKRRIDICFTRSATNFDIKAFDRCGWSQLGDGTFRSRGCHYRNFDFREKFSGKFNSIQTPHSGHTCPRSSPFKCGSPRALRHLHVCYLSSASSTNSFDQGRELEGSSLLSLLIMEISHPHYTCMHDITLSRHFPSHCPTMTILQYYYKELHVTQLIYIIPCTYYYSLYDYISIVSPNKH